MRTSNILLCSGVRGRRLLRSALPMTLALWAGAALTTGVAHAGSDVLILDPSVIGGATSLEATTVAGLGMTFDIVSAAIWPSPPQAYNQYKAIILGDPKCGGESSIAAAEANAAIWAAAVTGNVVVIGTDPTLHRSVGITGAGQLWKSAIAFAAAGPGTGAVIDLSCYYTSTPASPPKQVAVLNGFGTFITQGANCSNTIDVVAASPALVGLTNATLSGWSCSVHEGFTAWDASFLPLAIATDSTVPHNFTAGDGNSGFPYILARGKTVVPIGGGTLKVCKVAGPGITPGAPFTFTAGTSSFTVPAGPAPGGTCVVGPTFPVSASVSVAETVPTGDTVTSITVAPPGRVVGAPNLGLGTVNLAMGTGVTEVTYTDALTGYLEICKTGTATGSFSFSVNPGGLGPFVVPAGACSPAIQVVAGTVTIQEAATSGSVMTGCSTLPAAQQGPCSPATHTSTVTVAPGDISTQTIAFLANAPIRPAGGGTILTTVALRCAEGATAASPPLACTARAAASPARAGTPTGAITLSDGNTTLSTVQLGTDGSAAFSISTLAAGAHILIASYSGDATFLPAISPPVDVTIANP